MLVIVSSDFIQKTGHQYSVALVCALGKLSLAENTSTSLWACILSPSEKTRFSRLNDSTAKDFASELKQLETIKFNSDEFSDLEKKDLLCGAILKFRDRSADLVYVLDIPESNTLDCFNSYFGYLGSNLRSRVAHLEDINFLLTNEFAKLAERFGNYHFSISTSDSRVSQLIEDGIVTISEFMSTSVLDKFVKLSGGAPKASQSSESVKPTKLKRKRSISPASSQSFNQMGSSEFDRMSTSDFGTSELSLPDLDDATSRPTNTQRAKKRRVQSSLTSRAARLLKLSLRSTADESIVVDKENVEKPISKKSQYNSKNEHDVSWKARKSKSPVKKDSFGNLGHSKDAIVEKSEGVSMKPEISNELEVKNEFIRKSKMNKLYSKDEVCEVLCFSSKEELFKHVGSQLKMLPEHVSLIGLRQIQQALFQVNSFHAKYMDLEDMSLISDLVSGISASETSVEKLFIVRFEAFRYVSSSYQSCHAFLTSTLSDTRLSIEELCKANASFVGQFEKFLRNTFFEWYLQRRSRSICLQFASETCSGVESLRTLITETKDSLANDSTMSDEVSDEELDGKTDCSFLFDSTKDLDSSLEDVFYRSQNQPPSSSQFKTNELVNSLRRPKKRFSTHSNSVKYLLEEPKKVTSLKSFMERTIEPEKSTSIRSSLIPLDCVSGSKLVAKLEKTSDGSQRNKLQSRMLQRSLSQCFSQRSNSASESSVSKLSEKTDFKTSRSKLASEKSKQSESKSSLLDVKRILRSAQKQKNADPKNSNVRFMVTKKRKRSHSKTPGKSAVKESKRKRLLTKKVLETPGHKLQSRLSEVDDQSKTEGKVGETPLAKLPKRETTKDGFHLCKISSLCSKVISSKSTSTLSRRESFYKNEALLSPLLNEPGERNQKTPLIKCSEIMETQDLLSPFTLIFKADDNGKVSTAILTPAKTTSDMEDFQELDFSDETPLRGIFSLQNESGKKFEAIHGLDTLSLASPKVPQDSIGHNKDHLTRSTTKITQLQNVKLQSSASKKSSNVRKSLFSGHKSPKKFKAQSSFHDDKPKTVYRIFSEDSNSMGVLSEILNRTENKPETSTSYDWSTTNSVVDDFSFSLKKNLAFMDRAKNKCPNNVVGMFSPSPVDSPKHRGSSELRQSLKSQGACIDASTNNKKCSNLSMALDDLLKNPFASSSLFTGTSPA